MTVNGFEVGQTVLLVESYGRRVNGVPPISEKTVTRVGRKYVYVEQYGRERPFLPSDITPGSAVEQVNYGIGDVIYTEPAYAERQRRDELIKLLTKPLKRFDRMPTEKLEALWEVLQ